MVSNYGTKHPVVARLKVQTHELLQWARLSKEKNEQVIGLYFDLADRLLKCHELYERLLRAKESAFAEPQAHTDPRVSRMPHLVGLRGELETFLYEGKNVLRQLASVVNSFFDTRFLDASAFVDPARTGHGKLVAWATQKFGASDGFTTMLLSDQEWLEELIRKRNAVEHPGGRSGTLKIENFSRGQSGDLVPPSWQLGSGLPTPIFDDLENFLHNLLTFAEELLVFCIAQKSDLEFLKFAEIPERDRNPACPIRLIGHLEIRPLGTPGE